MMIPPPMPKGHGRLTRDSDLNTDTAILIDKSSSERERRCAERKMTNTKLPISSYQQNLRNPAKFSSLEISKIKHQQHMSQKSGIIGSSSNGSSSFLNYWKRSKWSWLGMTIIILALVWLFSYYCETQRKLRFESYLERAEELDAMIKQMEVHISSAQSKLQEVRMLQNPSGM